MSEHKPVSKEMLMELAATQHSTLLMIIEVLRTITMRMDNEPDYDPSEEIGSLLKVLRPLAQSQSLGNQTRN